MPSLGIHPLYVLNFHIEISETTELNFAGIVPILDLYRMGMNYIHDGPLQKAKDSEMGQSSFIWSQNQLKF